MIKVLMITAVIFALHTATLFGAAGTFAWPMAWVVMAIYFLSRIFSVIFISPDLLKERASPGPGVERSDRLIAALGYLALYTGTFIVCGLDAGRVRPDVLIKNPVKIGFLVIYILGIVLGTWAAYTNHFFSTFVRIQKERGHTVISSGPYALIRHPGYAGIILAHLALPVALGSILGIIPAVIGSTLFVVRTAREDIFLSKELPGYREYQQTVRWRLLPGIW